MKTVELSEGRTAYTVWNPEAPKTVLFLHGGTLPSWTYDDIIEKTKDLDCRLITYDMYGRGESEAPLKNYDMAFYVQQLTELLNTLNVTNIDLLIGSSFGAAVSTYYTLKYSDRVKEMLFVSPAVNWKQSNKASYLLSLPYFGRFLFEKIGKKKAKKRALGFIESLPQDFINKYKEKVLTIFDLKNENFWGSFYSQLTSDALGNHQKAFKKLGRMNKKISVISGSQDREVPLKDIMFLKKHINSIDVHIVEGATHGLAAEEPEAVAHFVRSKILSILS